MKTSYSLDTGRFRRSQPTMEVSMTPMIDVIFLLLVFFLATSSFRIVEKLMPSSISETRPGSGQDELPPPEEVVELLDQVIVKIQQRDGGIFIVFNGQTLDRMEDLRERLTAISRLQSGLPIIIDPEPSIPASQVVRAYDWARSAGLTRVYLSTRREAIQ